MFGRKRFDDAFPDAAGMPMPIGLDLEWKPDANPSSNNPIALIQLACWDAVLLIRTVGCCQMPPWLTECLEDPSRVKITSSFDLSDRHKLRTTFGWDFSERVRVPSSFLDIADMAKLRRLPYGLRRMAAEFGLPMLKAKEVGCSNWSREKLTDAQRQYAADDAFFTLYLFGCLCEHTKPRDDTSALSTFTAWRCCQSLMWNLLEHVDNSEYNRRFMELFMVAQGRQGHAKANQWTNAEGNYADAGEHWGTPNWTWPAESWASSDWFAHNSAPSMMPMPQWHRPTYLPWVAL
jgi:ribonuclease D